MINEEKLIILADFIEGYQDFNQHSLDNDIIGLGNRLDARSGKLNPFVHTEEDYFGEREFAEKCNISMRDAVSFCMGTFSRLEVGLKNPDYDKNELTILSRKQVVNAIRKFVKVKCAIKSE